MREDKRDLLEWYLATLRKNAQSGRDDPDLTPMTLLDADRALVHAIVEQEVRSTSSITVVVPPNSKPAFWLVLAALVVIGVVVLMGCVIVGKGID